MSLPTIPDTIHFAVDPISLTTVVGGGLDLDTTINGTVTGNVNASMVGDPERPLSTLFLGDKDKPITTQMGMELLNLPRFTVQDIKDFMKTRVQLPGYAQICFKVFCHEVFSICMGGEQQVIVQPYVPNPHEDCKVPCCEPDTRPFPEKGSTGNLHVS